MSAHPIDPAAPTLPPTQSIDITAYLPSPRVSSAGAFSHRSASRVPPHGFSSRGLLKLPWAERDLRDRLKGPLRHDAITVRLKIAQHGSEGSCLEFNRTVSGDPVDADLHHAEGWSNTRDFSSVQLIGRQRDRSVRIAS